MILCVNHISLAYFSEAYSNFLLYNVTIAPQKALFIVPRVTLKDHGCGKSSFDFFFLSCQVLGSLITKWLFYCFLQCLEQILPCYLKLMILIFSQRIVVKVLVREKIFWVQCNLLLDFSFPEFLLLPLGKISVSKFCRLMQVFSKGQPTWGINHWWAKWTIDFWHCYEDLYQVTPTFYRWGLSRQ